MRAFLACLFIALVAAGGAYLANEPGTVAIAWRCASSASPAATATMPCVSAW